MPNASSLMGRRNGHGARPLRCSESDCSIRHGCTSVLATLRHGTLNLVAFIFGYTWVPYWNRYPLVVVVFVGRAADPPPSVGLTRTQPRLASCRVWSSKWRSLASFARGRRCGSTPPPRDFPHHSSGAVRAGFLERRKSTAQTCVWEGTCKRGPLVAEGTSGPAADVRRLSIVCYPWDCSHRRLA